MYSPTLAHVSTKPRDRTCVTSKVLHFLKRKTTLPWPQTRCHGSRQPQMMQTRQWPSRAPIEVCYQSAWANLRHQRQGRRRSPFPLPPSINVHLGLPLWTTLFLHEYKWQRHQTCLWSLSMSLLIVSPSRICNGGTAYFQLMLYLISIYFFLKYR